MARTKQKQQNRRKKQQRRSVPRGLATHQWVFTLTKSASFNAFTTLTGNFVISNPQDNFCGFTLGASNQIAGLAALYDQCRVDYATASYTYLETSLVDGTPPTGITVSTFQICFAYDPDGGLETAANIFDRRSTVKHSLGHGTRKTASFGGVPAHVSDDAVVQHKRFYDISTIATKPFNLGQVVVVAHTSGSTFNIQLLEQIRVTCTLKGLR